MSIIFPAQIFKGRKENVKIIIIIKGMGTGWVVSHAINDNIEGGHKIMTESKLTGVLEPSRLSMGNGHQALSMQTRWPEFALPTHVNSREKLDGVARMCSAVFPAEGWEVDSGEQVGRSSGTS